MGNAVATDAMLHLEVDEATPDEFHIPERGQVVEIYGDAVGPVAIHDLDEHDTAHWLRDVGELKAHMATDSAAQRQEHASVVGRPSFAWSANPEITESLMVQRPFRGRHHRRQVQ